MYFRLRQILSHTDITIIASAIITIIIILYLRS
jgi:hypothetical protein